MKTVSISTIIGSSQRALLFFLCTVCLASDACLAQVTAPGAEITLLSADYKFTEGPAADDEGNVYFTDQPNNRILRWSPGGKPETWLEPSGRSNGLFFDRQGNLIACADEKNELWKIQKDKTHEVLLSGFDGKLFNGPNDVWVAGDGAMYFTDPFYKRPYWERKDDKPQLPQRVYRLSSDMKQITVAADDFRQPNGIVGNADQKLLYIADIGAGKTYRYRIGDHGELTDRHLFCEMGSDGMTLDSRGNLYLTGKAGVTVFSPAGQQIQTIAVPQGWTANVCFGGADRKTLFITASTSVYTIAMDVAGLK
jgi:gluconolactonase